MTIQKLKNARQQAPGAVIATRFGEVHARVSGDGPPVLLLHGITESIESFADLQAQLAEQATVHALDLPGHGYSDVPRRGLTFDEMALWVEDYMAQVGLARAVVVGWSLGGGVALALAAHAPGRVASLVLLGSVGPGMDAPRNLALLRLPLVAELTAQLLRVPALRPALLRDVYHRSFKPTTRIAERYSQGWRVRERAPYLRDLMRSIDVAPLERALPRVRARAILVHGDRDRLVPIRVARRLAASLADARLIELPSTGHAPHHERPQAVLDAIRGELAGR